MRIVGVALVVVALASSAGAQAPVADSVVELHVYPFAEPVEANSVVTGVVVVEYHRSAIGLATGPTAVHLRLVELPPWAVATISPSTLHMRVTNDVPYGASIASPPQEAVLTLTLSPNAPAHTAGILRIEAVAEQNGNIKASMTEESILFVSGGEACSSPVPAANATEATTHDGLATATLGPSTAAAPPYAALAAGAAGALGGLGVSIVLQRQKR